MTLLFCYYSISSSRYYHIFLHSFPLSFNTLIFPSFHSSSHIFYFFFFCFFLFTALSSLNLFFSSLFFSFLLFLPLLFSPLLFTQHDTDSWTVLRAHYNDDAISELPYSAAAWKLKMHKGEAQTGREIKN